MAQQAQVSQGGVTVPSELNADNEVIYVSQGGVSVVAELLASGEMLYLSHGGVTVVSELPAETENLQRVSHGGVTVVACVDVTAPADLAATRVDNAVTLTWTVEPTATSYVIERSSDNLVWTTRGTVAGDVGTYVDSPSYVDYYYRLTMYAGVCFDVASSIFVVGPTVVGASAVDIGIPTRFQTIGLSISVFKPNIVPATPYYDPRGTLLSDNLAALVSGYNHEISADGGFTSASITLTGEQVDIEDWIENGLGRHVEVYDEGNNIVWEGFVNSYRANVGSLSVSGGPLMDVANQVVVVYTPVDPTADPPATGPETETTAAVDEDSQARFGVLETVYSGGQTQDAGAYQIRDTLLGDTKYPTSSETINPSGGSDPTITIECRGYGDWLDKYVFNYATTSTVAISDKIIAALAADPNKLFNPDYSRIDENLFLVPAAERGNATALTVIKSLVTIGDANDNRAVFGVYERRQARYNILPTTVKYEHRIGDASQRVDLFGGGSLVRPWQVRPGDWVFLPDYLVGRPAPYTSLRSDPRNIFIESVRYTMPYGVSLNGGRFSTLPQLLAKRGMIGGLG